MDRINVDEGLLVNKTKPSATYIYAHEGQTVVFDSSM